MSRSRAPLLGAIAFIIVLSFAVAQQPINFTIDANTAVAPWSHNFERCVGSGHAALALRSDYQNFLTRARFELGVQSVRFHGLFVDDMSVVLPGNSPNTYLFSFFNIDRIFDFLLSIGMKPFVEISFMPDLLASGNRTWSHYKANVTPPRSWDDWASLIKAFAQHLIDRYGLDEVSSWHFEVWNEPNCCPDNFYSGNPGDYFKLYQVTALALKSVNSRIPVGGPATAMSAWVPEFMSFCKENNVPYDFISTHEYPTDPPGPETRKFFSDVLKKTRSSVGSDTPLWYTEYDDGYNDATSYAAAFIAYQMYQVNGIVDGISWWVFSDLFEEAGMRPDPFNLDWMPVAGLMNVYGIPKASYRTFQLLKWSGEKVLLTNPGIDAYDTVAAYAIGGNGTFIFVSNWNIKRGKLPNTEQVVLSITGISAQQMNRAQLFRIDDTHTTATPMWVAMGKPTYLTPAQVALLDKASDLVPEALMYKDNGNGSFTTTVVIPPNSLYTIIIPA